MRRIAIPLQSFVGAAETKVVVAMPMYRMVSVSWLFNWWRLDKSPCVGLVAVEGARLPIAMSAIVKDALRVFPDWEWLVVLEDDVEPPVDAFLRIGGYDVDVDIVGGLNFDHVPPHQVNAFLEDGGRYRSVPAETVQRWVDKGDVWLHEVDAVAMGFTAIRRRVLQEWPSDVPMWQPLPPMQGQDIHFCHEARRQGRSVWLDTGMRCGHLSEVSVGYERVLNSDMYQASKAWDGREPWPGDAVREAWK